MSQVATGYRSDKIASDTPVSSFGDFLKNIGKLSIIISGINVIISPLLTLVGGLIGAADDFSVGNSKAAKKKILATIAESSVVGGEAFVLSGVAAAVSGIALALALPTLGLSLIFAGSFSPIIGVAVAAFAGEAFSLLFTQKFLSTHVRDVVEKLIDGGDTAIQQSNQQQNSQQQNSPQLAIQQTVTSPMVNPYQQVAANDPSVNIQGQLTRYAVGNGKIPNNGAANWRETIEASRMPPPVMEEVPDVTQSTAVVNTQSESNIADIAAFPKQMQKENTGMSAMQERIKLARMQAEADLKNKQAG